MTGYSTLVNALTMIVEWAGILFFYRKLTNKSEQPFSIPGLCCLLLLVMIYIPVIPALNATTSFSRENLLNQILRTGINWLAVYGYLRFSKDRSRMACGYLAMLYVLIYMVTFNLREAIRPFLSVTDPGLTGRIMLILLVIFQWGFVYLGSRLLKPEQIRGPFRTRWAVIAIAVFVELYFKWSLISPQENASQRPFDAVFYSLCATLGVFLLVVLIERNMAAQQRQSALEMEQMQMRYESKNTKRILQTSSDVRKLHHDMKNHLLALQALVESGGEAAAYLAEMQTRLEDFAVNVNTGSSIADALLAEKIEHGRPDHIRFNICADFSNLGFVHAVDLVTILGNAVDNAMEALRKLPEGQERIVYIKTSSFANMAVLRISNQFAGTLEMQNGQLPTGKEDKVLHGIGLGSIQKAVKRYGGNVETQFDNQEGWFRLIIMLPVS